VHFEQRDLKELSQLYYLETLMKLRAEQSLLLGWDNGEDASDQKDSSPQWKVLKSIT